MKTWPLAVALLLFASTAVRADLAPPPPPKDSTAPLEIVAGPKVAEARIQIPRKLLGKMTSLEEGADTSASAAPASRMHTIIAGVCLAMALSFGGLWLVRRGQPGTRSLTVLFGAVVFLGVGAAVFADRRPAPRPEANRTDNIVIEVVDKGETVKLIINKQKLAKVLEEKK